MPRVPTYDSPQVAANTLPAARLDAPQAANYGGQQLQQFGQANDRLAAAAGQIAADLARQANAARVDDSITGLVKADTDLRMQALQLRGRDAFERPDSKALPDEFVEKFDVIAREAESGLGNDAQKAAFRSQAAQLRRSLYSGLSSHVLSEWQTYQDQASEAKLSTASERIAAMPENDETAAQSLGAIESAVREKVRRNGGNEEMADAQVRKMRDAADYSRYQAWMQTDPLAAQASFQRNQAKIGPLMRNQIANELLRAGIQDLANVVKPWVAGAGGALTGSPWPPGTPRGIRNNNPGNIVQTAERWHGEVDGDDPRFKTFATPEAGIAAMGKNLLTYQNAHGLNTVSGIVSRWAPATGNDTGSYIAAVSKALAVKPEDKLDLRDAAVLTSLTGAMIGVENGKQPYSDIQLSTGINAALGKVKLPDAATIQDGPGREPAWRNPNAITGIPLIDNLPPAHRAQVLALAHAKLRQDGTQARASLAARANDASAEYLNTGQASNPPSEAEFLQAYGQDDGVRRYRELQDTATLGAQLQQTKTLSNADLTAMLKGAEPSPGEGYAEHANNYKILQEAVRTTIAARQKDPIQAAMQNPAYNLTPIANMEDQDALLTELSRRRSAMSAIAGDYGVRPAPLSKSESLAFADMLANKQTPDKIQILRQIGDRLGEEGMLALSRQIEDGYPSLAIAAMLSAYTNDKGVNLGQMYLEGLDAIAQNRAKIDPSAEFGIKARIYEAVNGVYQTPQERDAAAAAALGIYAKLKSDGRDNLDEAIELATGGISTINGSKVARPRGWSESRVRDALTIAAPYMIAKEGGQFIVGGQQIDAADFAKMLPGMRLQVYKQGTYTLGEGSRIVRNPDGSPYVLDLCRRADQFRAVQVQDGLGAYFPARPAPGLRRSKTPGA